MTFPAVPPVLQAFLNSPMRLPQLYVALSAILFCIGIIGVLTRRNVLIVLMSIELMLNAANLALVGFSRIHPGADAASVVLFIIVVAAIEAAVGLSVVVTLYRGRGTTKLDDLILLRG
jgi:NADH-quinone oxidoreductase subunit K